MGHASFSGPAVMGWTLTVHTFPPDSWLQREHTFLENSDSNEIMIAPCGLLPVKGTAQDFNFLAHRLKPMPFVCTAAEPIQWKYVMKQIDLTMAYLRGGVTKPFSFLLFHAVFIAAVWWT